MLELITIEVGMMRSNCYILNNDFNAVIIDPGDDSSEIIQIIKSKKLKPESIILTHGHFDHIGAVDEICSQYDIPVIINRADFSFLTNPAHNLSTSFFESGIIVKTQKVICVADQSMKLIGLDFKFISTPGHSPGSMCIQVSNYLFTGDTLFYMSVGNQFPPFGDFSLEIQSIKQNLLSLDVDYICYPGHGPKTSLIFEKENNPYLDSNSYGH